MDRTVFTVHAGTKFMTEEPDGTLSGKKILDADTDCYLWVDNETMRVYEVVATGEYIYVEVADDVAAH